MLYWTCKWLIIWLRLRLLKHCWHWIWLRWLWLLWWFFCLLLLSNDCRLLSSWFRGLFWFWVIILNRFRSLVIWLVILKWILERNSWHWNCWFVLWLDIFYNLLVIAKWEAFMELLFIRNFIVVSLKILNTLSCSNYHFTFIFNRVRIFIFWGRFIKVLNKFSLDKISIWNLSINLFVLKSFINQAHLLLFNRSLFLG